MKRLSLALLTALALALQTATAQIPDMKFRRLDSRDGVSSSQINSIFKDSRGFIWMGTAYGLDRYDGYRIKVFYSDPNDTLSLRNNFVENIYEAYDGRLWIKQGMNYTIYDPLTEKFDRHPEAFFTEHGVEGGIERVFIDSNKNFWVKTYVNSIFCFNPATGLKKRFKMGYLNDEVPPETAVVNFCEGTDCVVATTVYGELLGLDAESGTVVWRESRVKQDREGVMTDYVSYVDRDGNIWVVTNQADMRIFIRKDHRWYNGLAELCASRGIDGAPSEAIVWDVMQDDKGLLWLATDHEGVLVLDMKNGQLRQFTHDKYDETSLSDITAKHLYQDYNGNIWICTYKNGINLYVEHLSHFQTLEVGDVNTILEDQQGRLWFGTNERGLVAYDPATGSQEVFNKQNSGFASDVLVASFAARDGSLWFGTYEGGLMRWKEGHWRIWQSKGNQPQGLQSNNVWDITDDPYGNIWIGTLGAGIQKLDEAADTFALFNAENAGLSSNYVMSLGRSKGNWILAGTSEYYSLVSPKTGELVNAVIPQAPNSLTSSGTTVQVIQDSRGLYWQCSSAGVNVYDPKTKQVTLLDMHSGMMGSSSVAVVEDKRHTMWVSTDHGVSNITVQQTDGKWTFAVRSYNRRDGLQEGPYNQRAIYCARDGRILVGGQGGVDFINPAQAASERAKERPIFSGLVVFDQEIAVGREYDGRVILNEALDVSRELKLRYADNQFTIQLASDAGTINNQSRFVYRLQGFNDRWSKTSSVNPNVTYMSLRPGTYTLCVRMLRDDGTVGEEESQLKITIQPPLWRTRWAILLYMLAVLAVALLWRRRFLRRQEEQMAAQNLRREMEQQQWMNEMRAKIASEQAAGQTAAEPQAEEELQLQLNMADIVGFTRQVCDMYAPPEGKQVKLSFSSQLPVKMMSFDGQHIGRSITTLINNSVKFCPSNCRVQVLVSEVPDGGVTLSVADNGIGIRDEYKAHIFDPVIGSPDGLGLHSVRQVVEAHGGDIRVEDNDGGGTVFVLHLPQASVVHEEPAVEDAIYVEDSGE